MWGSYSDLMSDVQESLYEDVKDVKCEKIVTPYMEGNLKISKVVTFPQGSKLISHGTLPTAISHGDQFNDYLHRELLNANGNIKDESIQGMPSNLKFQEESYEEFLQKNYNRDSVSSINAHSVARVRQKDFNWNDSYSPRIKNVFHAKSEAMQVENYKAPNIQMSDVTIIPTIPRPYLGYLERKNSQLNERPNKALSKSCSDSPSKVIRHHTSSNVEGNSNKCARVLCQLKVKTRDWNRCFMCPFSSNHLPTFIKHVGKCALYAKNQNRFLKKVGPVISCVADNQHERAKGNIAKVGPTDSTQRKESQIPKNGFQPRKTGSDDGLVSHNFKADLIKLDNKFSTNLKVDQDESQNLKMKIIRCDKIKGRNDNTNNIDYQCPYCLRLFYSQFKMEVHIEKCAQLKPPIVYQNVSSNRGLSKETHANDNKVTDDIEFLSSIHSKRKSYIKALKSLKEDEDPAHDPLTSSKLRMKTKPLLNLMKTANGCSVDNGILTCTGCNYVTYRKWDLERHLNEKHHLKSFD